MKANDLTKNEIRIINTINKHYSTCTKDELYFFLTAVMSLEEFLTAINSLLYKQIITHEGNWIVVKDETINSVTTG